jgi:hypothetical protein
MLIPAALSQDWSIHYLMNWVETHTLVVLMLLEQNYLDLADKPQKVSKPRLVGSLIFI